MGRYSKGSTYQTAQRRRGVEPGSRDFWPNELIDLLLDLYFCGVPIVVMIKKLGKTEMAIATMLSKLKKPEKYKEVVYVPGPSRKTRTGCWNQRELGMLATLQKQKWSTEKICLFLGRSCADVEAQLNRRPSLF